MSSREPCTVDDSRLNVPSTLASIAWRFEASVSPLLPLLDVIVQPARTRVPAAAAAVVVSTKCRLFIVHLHSVAVAKLSVPDYMMSWRPNRRIGLWSYTALVSASRQARNSLRRLGCLSAHFTEYPRPCMHAAHARS